MLYFFGGGGDGGQEGRLEKDPRSPPRVVTSATKRGQVEADLRQLDEEARTKFLEDPGTNTLLCGSDELAVAELLLNFSRRFVQATFPPFFRI